ncbi:MAG: hypothetical protein NT130_03755 [Candidatus Micrarchaeota archaeon]|nr:hypothetical protein [Candidatus Micrarchaeota archaeon]
MVVAKKPDESGSSSKKELTTKEFVDFLVKEFGMSEGEARRQAFLHPPDQRELIKKLKEEMPKASFKGLTTLLTRVPLDNLLENIKTLEEHKLHLKSIEVLRGNPTNLKENIKTLEEHKLPLNQYIAVLRGNPTNLKENIKTLEEHKLPLSKSMEVLLGNPTNLKENIKTLEEHKLPLSKSMEALRRNPTNLKENFKTLEEHKINPTDLTTTYLLGMSPTKFMKILATPKKEKITTYSFSDKIQFEYLATRLHPDEQKAFNEIGKNIEEKGGLNRDEMEEIFKKHVASRNLIAASERLDTILQTVVKDGGLEKWEEMKISLNVPDFLRKKLREKQDKFAGHLASKIKQESLGPAQEEIETTIKYLQSQHQKDRDMLQDMAYLMHRYKDEQTRELIDKYRDKVKGKG